MWSGAPGSVSKEHQGGRSKPRPGYAALWLVWGLGVLLLLALGNWQWQRAEQKRQWLAQRSAAPLQLQEAEQLVPELARQRWVTVVASLEWVQAEPLLLDNRTHQGQAGYEVLQPARLADGTVVLVNRGWVAAPARRDLRPTVVPLVGEARVSALAGVPVQSFTLAGDSSEPWRLQSLSLEQAEAYWALGIAPWVLWLARDDGSGPVARLPGTGQLPPERHLGYAVQWFSLALTLFGLGLWLEWRRRRG